MDKKMTARFQAIVPRFPAAISLIVFLLSAVAVSATDLGPRRAPGFSLRDRYGQTVTLGSLAGKNALLLFGTTRCPHCDAAFPTLEQFADAGGTDLTVYFIAAGQGKAELIKAFGPDPLPYGVLADQSRIVTEKFGIDRVPTCVFIDAEGMIQYSGPLREQIIWRLLSGERPVYPQRKRRDIDAIKRIEKADRQVTRRTRRFIVELSDDAGATKTLSTAKARSRRRQYADAVRQIGAKVVHNYGKLQNRIVVEMDPDKIERLKKLPRFKSVKEDRRVRALLEDSAYQIRADYAWDSAITGDEVKVCVIDTGIDYTHPDLRNKVIAQYNPMDDSQDAMDDNGHGTHCAGIIASSSLKYGGVSPDVSLLAAKVLDYSGDGFASDVILGVNWCVEEGADVISMSLGEGLFTGTCDDNDMGRAVNAAVDAGAVVVCAAGNDGNPNAMVSPACASKVIAVGALDKNDNIASYSDGGVELDVVAPGGGEYGGSTFPEIASTYSTEVANNPFYCLYLIAEQCYDDYFLAEGDLYIRAVGTSMAAPHVAGAAALLLEENPSLAPSQIQEVLQANADDLGTPGWDNIFGWGRINIERALDNLPAEAAELAVTIAEPNASEVIDISTQFPLEASIDCFGGDGCGDVEVHAQYCEGRDCNDFADINEVSVLSTLDNNPNSVGVLSGYSVETDMPAVFDAATTLDISQSSYSKTLNAQTAPVGSLIPSEYSTGDLEPDDMLGAIGENVAKLYSFDVPEGTIKKLSIRLENYMVIHWDHPPFATWQVYTSNESGEDLHLVGECTPPEGGGGEAIPPDCWFVSEDPAVLADLTAGETNYIRLVSYGVESNDWLTFNDIEVLIEYAVDPENDEVHRYYVKFDISELEPADDITGARLKIDVAQAAAGSIADVHFVDETLLPIASAQALHEPADPCYSGLANPVKSFSCETTGLKNLNIKGAVEEALAAGRDAVAFQISERNDDQVVSLYGMSSENAPSLTISRRVAQLPDSQSSGNNQANETLNGSRPLTYDTVVTRALRTDQYSRSGYPDAVTLGADFTSEFRTGDLEPEDGIGATGENAEKLYDFEMPAGPVNRIRIKMVNYLVVHFDHPPFATWQVYLSNADGANLELIGECTPAEGGGGEAQPPDCWFTSDDPEVLTQLAAGATQYIKVVSTGVGPNDWLTFSELEVMVDYEIDAENDQVSRYYVTFDISEFASNVQIDSASLNLYVEQAGTNAVGDVNLVNPTYDPAVGAYTIFHAESLAYSSQTNPIKSFSAETVGPVLLNVKGALEDAIDGGANQIAFLVSERNEKDRNARFAIKGSASANPPRLDVYVKSGISGAKVHWNLLPADHGDFTLRVLATNDIGARSVSDARVVTIEDPNLPVIGAVECMVDSQWGDCKSFEYGDVIERIRVEASDRQDVPDVRLVVRNVPDDQNFVDVEMAYSDGVFTDETNLLITDSGQWQIRVRCSDSDNNMDSKTISWTVPWGRLSSYIVSPFEQTTVAKSGNLTIRAGIECLDAECPASEVGLQLNEPNELKYDDRTAEDYGDLGSTDSYIAVKFEPETYPAQIRTARFYVWDETAYPFEIHVWDDDGPGGTPGTELVAPFAVDPVVASGPEEVAWFDVDMTQYDIIVESGQFYIGWRQIEAGKVNQVGFDQTGMSYRRTWGYLPSLGWFNLDDYCQFCSLMPDFCDFCGNIMIRAVVGEPGKFEGDLPRTAAGAPLYSPLGHPGDCPNMKAGETCERTFEVYAVGTVGERATVSPIGHNRNSYDVGGSLVINIAEPENACDAANLDAIGRVDLIDLALVNGQIGRNEPSRAMDANGDGKVDLLDLATLAQYWLMECP